MSSQEPSAAAAAAVPSPVGAGAAATTAAAPVTTGAAAAGHVDDAAAAVRWDRARWISVFSSHSPTIREVTESLGLGLSASSSTTNRGIPKFDNPDYRRLSSDVTRLSKELPKERDALLDFAADPHSLDRELEDLLATFGPAIWGRDTDRSCLLTPDPAKKTYQRHLYYEDPDDQRILKTHLHRWIIIKACYYIRNMKLKRFSHASDYDTQNDLEHDDPGSPAKHPLMPSPTTTSAASTPADGLGATDQHTLHGKKRKSSVFTSLSDGEDPHHMGSPTKRPYQSHTLPLPRKSPRKSLKPFPPDSPVSENVPPVPSLEQSRHASLAPALAPLSSNDLNGATRSNGFTPVNTGVFTAVNTAPPTRDAAPHGAPLSNGRNYSSPYESNAYGTSAAPSTQKSSKGPPLNTASAGTHSFQAINSPVANGGSAHNSPVVPNPSQPPVPHQQPQPKVQTSSRSNTPSLHHRSSLTHQRSSRSNTPIAPASAPKVQSAPAPAVQPVSATTGHVPPAIAPRNHHHAAPPIASVPNAAFYAHQPQPVLKSHPVDPAVPPAQQSLNTIDFSALQSECLGYLVQYLFPRPNSPPDENLVLHRIETLWHLGATIFHKQIGPTYDLQTNILYCWITERRKISQLHNSIATTPGVPLVDMVDRLLAMNDLRLMRLKWKNMSSADGLSSEDLLCRTFAVMTNTEGAEYMFKDGLDRVNEAIFEFMRREDMKILIHRR